MSTLKTPFRYDFVGSFLRPEKLKAAKKAFEEGTITQEELDRVTDECVTEIVAKQKAAGFHAITDGEFRRKFWHLDFMWGFDGVGHVETKTGLPFHGEAAMIDDRKSKGKGTSVCRRVQIPETVRRREYGRKIYNSGTGTDVSADDRSAEHRADEKVLCNR